MGDETRSHLDGRRRALAGVLLFLMFLLFCPSLLVRAADPIALVLTADTEGHLSPCRTCPAQMDFGGLARRSTLVGRLREENSALLLLDAGNALFGPESLESRGQAIVSAYNTLGYDAVNLSYRDFRLGKAETLAVLKEAKFAVLSANLLDAEKGEPLARPYVVKDAGAEKVALLGVTEAPAGLDFLPHLKEQLAGIRIEPPVEAIGRWLPKAKAESNRVILLYYGSAGGLRLIQEKFGAELAAILVGGIRPDYLPVDAKPPLIATSEHGQHVARARLGAAGADGKVEVAQVAVDASLIPDPAMENLLAPREEPARKDEPTPARSNPFEGGVASAERSETVAKPEVIRPRVEEKPRPEAAKAKKPASEEKPPDSVTARQPRQPKGLAGVGLTAEQVNRAIDRGSEFLWNYLKTEDLQKGHATLGNYRQHVLACLALVHSNAHKRFPDFDAELRAYLARVEPHRHTYQDGLLCMLVESYGDATFLPQLQRSARYLLEAQGPEGSWNYAENVPPELYLEKEEAGGRALRVSGGVALDGTAPKAEPWRRQTPWEKGGDGDTSNMQYATLGLYAASRSGIRLSEEAWKRNLDAYRGRQNPDGGFNYHGGSSYASMTCAGICGVAICLYQLGEKDWASDPAIERGLTWIEKNFSVERNVGASDEWVHYYLYSLERVGRILDTEFIGSHEWYPLGARHLVDKQQGDGSWKGQGIEDDPRLATSFALLFLTRATPTLNVERKRGGSGTLKTVAVLPPRLRFYVILDCSGSMLEEMDGKQKFHIAREAVAALARELPEGAEVALRVYGHRRLAIEDGASEDTELLLPLRKLEREAFLAKVESLRARGKTPLARSLLEAKADLSDLSSGGEKDSIRVVLLTDGGEDTFPRQDPLKAADEFSLLKGVRLYIVGFDINREDWSEQLQAIARRARGQYLPAARGEALVRELRSAVLGMPDEFRVVDAEGREMGRGHFGESKLLPEGKYRFRTKFGGQAFEEEFWINTEATTALVFDAERVAPSPAAGPRLPASSPGAQKPAPREAPSAPSAAAKKFCTACGKRLMPGAKFCTGCGARAPN